MIDPTNTMRNNWILVVVACLGWKAHCRITAPACLTSAEAEAIAKGWLKIWETDSKGTRPSPDVVMKTVTPDFELYDAGIVPANPDAAMLYKNGKEIANDFADQSKWVSETDEKYNLIFSFASCDMVGVRWEMHGKSGKHENTYVASIAAEIIPQLTSASGLFMYLSAHLSNIKALTSCKSI